MYRANHRPSDETGSWVLRCLVLLDLAMMFLVTQPAGARAAAGLPGGLSVESMSLSVRPEYDRSDVLVVYDAVLVNRSTSAYSGEVFFQVPEGTGSVHGCEITPDGEHVGRLPKTEVIAGYRVAKWNIDRKLAPGERYHAYVEFYYNPIQKAKGRKLISYEFVPLAPTARLDLVIVEPLRARDFQSLPPPGASIPVVLDGVTFNSHAFQFESLTERKPVQVTFSYSKADDLPSVARSAGQTSSPSRSTGVSARSADPALLGIGAALAGALGFFLYRELRRPVRDGASTASTTDERKLARQLLLKGHISETTYKRILKDLEREGRGR